MPRSPPMSPGAWPTPVSASRLLRPPVFSFGSNVVGVVVGAGEGAAAATKKTFTNDRRVVRVSLIDGTFLDPDAKVTDRNKVPARPFVGDLVKRGSEEQKRYVPSLDPVRMPGKVSRTTDK